MVEQPPHCDPLRLIPGLEGFVRSRRAFPKEPAAALFVAARGRFVRPRAASERLSSSAPKQNKHIILGGGIRVAA